MQRALCQCESLFIKEHLSDFLSRFRLTCSTECQCCDYNIFDRTDNRKVSSSLVLSLNTFSKQIHVSRFYPELYREPESRYLSATCFYLLVHHFAQAFHLETGYRIYLESRTDVFHAFYEKLKDFDLHVKKQGMGSGHVDVWCKYVPVSFACERFCRTSRVAPDL